MSIRAFSFVTIIVTYILIVFGGYVASSQSGMGCGPDWPLCNGVLIPVLKGATLIEYAHRIIGAILFLLTLLLFLRVKRERSEKNVRNTALWMMIILGIQIILGAIVVVLDLPAIVVTIHLLIAMAFLACLLYIWRSQKLSKYEGIKKTTILRHLSFLILLLAITLGLGAYIKHQSYGLACDWLNCQDSLLPVSHAQIIQTLHRACAFISTIYLIILTYWSYKNEWGTPIQKRLLLAIFTVLVQLLIGVFTIVTTIAIPWAVLHLAAATALFAIIIEAWISIHLSFTKIRLLGWTTKKINTRL